MRNEKENSTYSIDDNNKEKDKEKGKTKESEEFLPAYLALLPTIIGSDVCVNCRGTRFAGPFLVCGKCNGEMSFLNKKTDRVIDTLMIVHHFFYFFCYYLVAFFVKFMLVIVYPHVWICSDLHLTYSSFSFKLRNYFLTNVFL